MVYNQYICLKENSQGIFKEKTALAADAIYIIVIPGGGSSEYYNRCFIEVQILNIESLKFYSKPNLLNYKN